MYTYKYEYAYLYTYKDADLAEKQRNVHHSRRR